jgi:hypothetical protein
MSRLQYDLYHDWCDDCRPRLAAQPAWRPRRNTTAASGVTSFNVDPTPRPSTSSGTNPDISDPNTAYGRYCGRMQHFNPLPTRRDPDRVPTPTSGHPPAFAPHSYAAYQEDRHQEPLAWDGTGKADMPKSATVPNVPRSAGPAPPTPATPAATPKPPSVINLTPDWEDRTLLQRQYSNASKGRMRRFFS